MLILLPPSEGKAVPNEGPPLDLMKISFRDLDAKRAKIMDRLIAVSKKTPSAMRVLGLGPTQKDELNRNCALATAPVAPAIEIYTGVLYEALNAATLAKSQRERLGREVLIASALWGLVQPGDLIPAYRLSGDTSLPGIGPIATAWKPLITSVLAQQVGPILDLRSGAYRFGVLPICNDVAIGRVLLERNGKRSVVSHHNKATKGCAVRALMTSRRTHRSLDDIAATLEAAGIQCAFETSPRGVITMDLVTREL